MISAAVNKGKESDRCLEDDGSGFVGTLGVRVREFTCVQTADMGGGTFGALLRYSISL